MPNRSIVGTTVLLFARNYPEHFRGDAKLSYTCTATGKKVWLCLLRKELCQRSTMPGSPVRNF